MTERLLIGTDPGIDDAFAILYALKSPDFDVLGLTTVYGNASIEQTTHNARALVDMGGKPCPVAQGAADPPAAPPAAARQRGRARQAPPPRGQAHTRQPPAPPPPPRREPPRAPHNPSRAHPGRRGTHPAR